MLDVTRISYFYPTKVIHDVKYIWNNSFESHWDNKKGFTIHTEKKNYSVSKNLFLQEVFAKNQLCMQQCLQRMTQLSLSEKVFQGPKVVVNRFGWNLAQKLGIMRYFKSHFGSLLRVLVLQLQEGSHFLPFEHQKSRLPGGILKVWYDPTGKLCCQMNLTMNSTITELSVHACNFVPKVLHREEPGARVCPKLMLKLQPKIAIFQNFTIFTCLLA